MAGKKKQGIAGLKETTGGMKRDDRQSVSKYYFEPISIDAENAQTVIYMLRSPEGSVVLRAVASLERFGRKAPENLEILSSMDVFQFVIPLVKHEDYLVRRFAQKLISLLASVEDFRQQIFADDATVCLFVSVLETEEDVVMHEYASLTLAKLTSECLAAAKILQVERCVDTLYARLTSSDPDVQKNCLDTMRNLLNEIDGVKYFTASPYFELRPIIELISSSYPVIQMTALQVIEQFVSWSMDNKILFTFRDSSGLEEVITVVENWDWSDLHLIALDILLKVVDNSAACEYLQQSGCLQRLVHLLEIRTDKSYIEKILGVLARVSQTKAGQKALHANGMGQTFGKFLQSDWPTIQESACLGIASLAQYPPSLDSIMSSKPTSRLLDTVTNTANEWKLRELASYALNVLSHEDGRVAEELLKDSKFERLLSLLGPGFITIEATLNILQVFIGIAAIEKCRVKIITETLFQTIMDLTQSVGARPARVCVAALEALSSLIIEDAGRTLFQSLDGARKLVGCLKNRYASIRQWAALLVTQMAHNVEFVKSFIRCQGLQWLIDQRDMRYSAPSWESAIEAVFRAYLPAKFAFTGRLDLHDLTREGFFILRHQQKLFFILDDLLEIRASPAYPVYVANFEINFHCRSATSENSLKTDSHSSVQSNKPDSRKKGDGREKDVDKMTARGIRAGDEYSWHGSILSYDSYDRDIPFSLQLESFGMCPRDPYLPDYLVKLRALLVREIELNFRDPQWLGIHPKLIRQRAQILARFVADEMCGPDPDPICKDHYLDMHINDIRYELETNIIPIGHVRVGSYLERAFLFKILADKIGLPCALVRGSYGRAWVEIAVPVINVNDHTETKETQTAFPATPPPSLQSAFMSTQEEDDSAAVDGGWRMCSSGANRWPKSAANRDKFLFPPLDVAFCNAFPTKFLKPNAIVDLVHEPGRIFPIHSYEADDYKGNFHSLGRKLGTAC